MESEKVARVLGAIVVAATLVAAFVYWPATTGRPAKPVQKTETPVAAPPPVKGPVVREVPQ